MDDDEELERLKFLLRWLTKRADAEEVASMEAELDSDGLSEVSATACVLFGFEGSIDETWEVPEPRPEVLCRPISPRLTMALDSDDPCVPTLRVAEYRRVGESTYQRTR